MHGQKITACIHASNIFIYGPMACIFFCTVPSYTVPALGLSWQVLHNYAFIMTVCVCMFVILLYCGIWHCMYRPKQVCIHSHIIIIYSTVRVSVSLSMAIIRVDNRSLLMLYQLLHSELKFHKFNNIAAIINYIQSVLYTDIPWSMALMILILCLCIIIVILYINLVIAINYKYKWNRHLIQKI